MHCVLDFLAWWKQIDCALHALGLPPMLFREANERFGKNQNVAAVVNAKRKGRCS